MQTYKHILSHEFSNPGTSNVTLHQKIEIRKGLFLLHVEKATKNDRNIFASCIQRFFLFLIVFCSILSLWHFLPLCLHTIISFGMSFVNRSSYMYLNVQIIKRYAEIPYMQLNFLLIAPHIRSYTTFLIFVCNTNNDYCNNLIITRLAKLQLKDEFVNFFC